MSVGSILTLGLGSFGGYNKIVTIGYNSVELATKNFIDKRLTAYRLKTLSITNIRDAQKNFTITVEIE